MLSQMIRSSVLAVQQLTASAEAVGTTPTSCGRNGYSEGRCMKMKSETFHIDANGTLKVSFCPWFGFQRHVFWLSWATFLISAPSGNATFQISKQRKECSWYHNAVETIPQTEQTATNVQTPPRALKLWYPEQRALYLHAQKSTTNNYKWRP